MNDVELHPDDLLQTPDDIWLVLWAMTSRDGLQTTMKHGAAPSDGVGRPVACLGSTGDEATHVKVLGRSVEVPPQAETLVCFEEPASWLDAPAFAVHVRPIEDAPKTVLPEGTKAVLTGVGPRKTVWRSIGRALPSGVVHDGVRGLGLSMPEPGLLVMDWYHARLGSVFDDVAADFRRGKATEYWAGLESGLESRALWNRARPTMFRLERL